MKRPTIDAQLRFLYLFTFLISYTSAISSDGLSLLALKAAITQDPTSALVSWSESDSTPCKWAGIVCGGDHRKVTSISLSGKNLTGYIPSVIGALTSLTFLDLSHNAFGGPLPHHITTLRNLVHLDVSSNNLNGSLPESLSNLTHLEGTLNLSCNAFSGDIPASFGLFPVMLSLDLRRNNLTGKIPQVGSLINQGPTAFSGNPYLCGFPLSTPCADHPLAQNPIKPELNDGISSNVFVEKRKIKSGVVTISMILGVCLVVGVILVAVWVIKKKWKIWEGKTGRENASAAVTVGKEEGQKGKFVALDEGFSMELEDLLRASAYVLGKSRSGIVYKVVVSGGGKGGGISGVGGGAAAVVAVRRLSEGDAKLRFKEFEAEMEAVDRVRHPNIVRLKAYYYAIDEKLLISDFIGNGSLHNALHGPAKSSPPLSWSARLRIVQESARALTHIHECSHKKYVHGNIKSSKILLDDALKPYISGFGLSRLLPTTSKSANTSSSTNMYLAPEAGGGGSRRITQKCDVYAFGVVLLEVLTGRGPECGPDNDGEGVVGLVRKVFGEERPLSEIIDAALLHEVQAKRQVVAAFHVGLSCTEVDPELRPRMRTVCDNLDSIKVL